MSDTMLFGVLRMPYELAMSTELSRRQFHDRAQQACDALEAMQADAARYRWLRGGADIPLESNRWARWEVRYWCGRWWSTMFADQLDTTIDVARRQE